MSARHPFAETNIMAAATLRVWSGCEKNHRRIVAARSYWRAIALLDTTPDKFNEWYAPTHDSLELSVATSEGVWDSLVVHGRARTHAEFKPWRAPKTLQVVFPSWQAFDVEEHEN